MVEALPRVANSPLTGLVWYVPDRTKLIYAFKTQNQASLLVCNFKSWHSWCVRFAYIGPKIWLGVAHLVASSLLTWALFQRNYVIFMKTRHTSTHKIYLVLIQSKLLEKWLKEFGIITLHQKLARPRPYVHWDLIHKANQCRKQLIPWTLDSKGWPKVYGEVISKSYLPRVYYIPVTLLVGFHVMQHLNMQENTKRFWLYHHDKTDTLNAMAVQKLLSMLSIFNFHWLSLVVELTQHHAHVH